MKISKIFAGMSALAIAATMAISASASTTIPVTDGQTEDWASAFAKNGEGDDFIDAKSLTKDTALDVKVDFTWTETGTAAGYVELKPAFANGWNALAKTEGYVSGITLKSATTGAADETSHKYVDAEGNEYDYVLQDNDGFIVCNLPECNSFEFTVSADCVNALIENANKDENAFDGLIFQIYGLQVTNVELSQDNVKLNSQMATGDDTSSTGDTSSKADTSSSSSSSAASSSSKSSSTTSTKAGSTSTAAAATSSKASDNTNAATGATAGIALAGLALAGAAVVVAKRK